jgi:hypothetical protein
VFFFFALLLLLWLSCWLLWNQPRTKPQVSVHHHQLTFTRMAGQHSQDYCLTFSTQQNWKQPNKQNLLIFPCAKNTKYILYMRFETWDLRSNLKHEIWQVLLDLDFMTYREKIS